MLIHDLAQPLVVLDGYLLALSAVDGMPDAAATWVSEARQASGEMIDMVDAFRRSLLEQE